MEDYEEVNNAISVNRTDTRHNNWITGTIKTIDSVKQFGFITPSIPVCGTVGRRGLPKDVHFNLSRAKWPVRQHESVEFKLDTRRADKPTAWMIKRYGYPDDEEPQRAPVRQTLTRPRDRIRDRAPEYSGPQNNEPCRMNVETVECRSDADESSSESDSKASTSDSESSDSGDERAFEARVNLDRHVKTTRIRKPLMFQNSEQLYGKIDHMKDNFGFIQPKAADADNSNENVPQQIYFNLSNVHSGNFCLSPGDDISYFESKGQGDRAYAVNVRPVKLQRRSTEVFENYLGYLQGELNSTLGLEKIVLAITCVPIWQSLGSCRSLSIDAIAMLNTLIIHLDKYDSLSVNVAGILDSLLSTPLFRNIDGPFGSYVKMIKEEERRDKIQEMYQAIMTMARLVPHKVRIIINLLEPVLSSDKKSLDNFLYKLLRQCTKGAAAGRVDDMDWDEMPLVPSVQELISGPLETTASLRSVITVGPYPSAQEYVDIYFRLLRADCFSALSKGVTDLLKGKLDPRDMNVYTHIKFAGVQITRGGSGISLGLTIVPQRSVVNWDQSTNLLFGNLLCISVTGTFKDPIWATVVNRDLLKSHKMVIIDLCSESNSMSDSEAILSLYFMNASTIMVESPTYYRAYQPILKSLQTMDPEELAFKEELVQCKSGGVPKTISDESEFPGSIIYDQFTTKLNAMCYCLDESSIGVTSLDASQEAAIKECLGHRVAIVQGPPGTGKTFIGVKVVEILLSMNYSSESSVMSRLTSSSSLSNGKQHPPSTPIVILTYKNHALDEFLKEMLKIFPNQVARVGGRSQDLDISNCSLNELRKKIRMSADMFNQVKEFRSQLDRLKDEVESSFDSLTNKKYFNVDTLVESLSQDQIINFLMNCDWTKAKVKPFSDSGKDKDGFRVVSKIILRQDVVEILRRCQRIKIHDELKSVHSKDSLGGKLYHLLKGALKQWIPPISKFIQFERNFIEQNGGLSTTYTKNENNSLGTGRQSDVDSRKMDLKEMLDIGETDVEDTLKERLAAMHMPSGNSREEILKSIKLFKGVATTDDRTNGSNPYLMDIAKELSKKIPLGILLGVENIWELFDVDRIKLVQCLLYRQFEDEGASFDEIFTEYLKVYRAKEELEDQHKVSILRRMKIVGMTITGANIHRQLLSQLGPEVVIVEEAAEVLEPQLIAVIGSWVQHLIMIGDHLQLRPSVENYMLVKHYHLDVSMMERLINNDLPYASLTMQNRMKPEFANLLLDIYPKLQSNLSRVERNNQANCIEKSMYFWDHEDLEQSGRSYINENEAERAVRLALFLIMQGYAPETITILSPYLGQVSLIRRKVKKAESEFSSLFDMHISSNAVKSNGDKNVEGKNSIHVHTVDLYQGDENDFVIISLVRSNAAGKLGFVGILNRRCVAQSRSRRGLYFIGNRKTISQSKNWMPVLHKLEEAGCVGSTLNLNCPFHLESKMSVKDAAGIPLTENFCKVICYQLMACNNHICYKRCQPRHSHAQCKEKITFTFKTCGHVGERCCYQEEKDIRCAALVPILKFEFCDHSGNRKCYQELKNVKCKELCTKILSCGHPCSEKCGDLCNVMACQACERIREEEAEQRRQLEKRRRQVLLDSIDLEIKNIKESNLETVIQRTSLSKNGDTASEYLDIEDLVRLFVQPGHNWFPEVTQIEKLTNFKLELRWLEIQKKLHDPSNHKLKFHGTNTEAVESIISTGFLMPKPQKRNRSMFGAGIYFASDSSKSAQDRYTKGSNMLFVCDVLLGKTYTVDTAMRNMTGQELNKKGYDSLFAKRGTKNTGGVLNDEFVVFNPDQALPRYIVHFKTVQYREAPCATQLEQAAIASKTDFIKHSLINRRDAPSGDPYQFHFCVAESQFKRLMQKQHLRYVMESIDYYINRSSLERFSSTMAAMKQKYDDTDNSKKCEFTLEFCSARSKDVETIMSANSSEQVKLLQVDGPFGTGVYFSDYPDAIRDDAQGLKKLLLCKVLQGQVQTCKSNREPRIEGFDSLHFNGDDRSSGGNELIIFNTDQILPLYVIHFK